MLDEANQDSVSTQQDILPALNRAQDFAFDVYARRYPEPILGYQTLQLVSGQDEYDIPENVFEDRILKVDVTIPSGSPQKIQQEVLRISYRDITLYESPARVASPQYYCIIGRKIRFVACPNGVYPVRLWYLRNPERLVLPQGRVTHLNSENNYCIVDAAGGSLTTESDQLGSYVNWVDGQTGEIKATLQIASLSENRIGFRSSPLRSTVLNRAVSGSIPANAGLDDYLSPVEGICVPYYGRPTGNFMIQYAIAEISRKLGGEATLQEEILKKFEQQVERTWVGREQTMRIAKRSHPFGAGFRRWWWGSN